jgi:hypothetical protein
MGGVAGAIHVVQGPYAIAEGFPPTYRGLYGDGYLAVMHFDIIGTGDPTAGLGFMPGGVVVNSETTTAPVLWDFDEIEQPSTWSDTCCLDATVDTTPDDEILPGENVTIAGSGFAPSTQYDVWIVPYTEDSVVAEGQTLATLGAPGMVNTVTSDAIGDFVATVWQVPQDPGLICSLYEIVVDNGDGVYMACDDGLDALGLREWGFHIWPEALTITLLSLGMVGLGGYYAVRRRRAS